MHNTHKILIVLLALMLVGSNMAYSGHVSRHALTDFSLCSLCIHPGGSDHSIVPEPAVHGVIPAINTLTQNCVTRSILPLISHDHQSRAPPLVT